MVKAVVLEELEITVESVVDVVLVIAPAEVEASAPGQSMVNWLILLLA